MIGGLLDAGLRVIAAHPNQVVGARCRYTPAGGKSDSFDSFVLAEPARTEATGSGRWCPTATAQRHQTPAASGSSSSPVP